MSNDSRFDGLIAGGLQASREDRREAALALFEQAAALAPLSGVPHFLIGSEHACAGDIPAAEAAFERAVELTPDFALARYQLGLLQFSTHRPGQALVTWRPLFDLPSADPLHHFVRGFEALARDSFDEALHHYREGLARNDINQALSADVLQVVEAVRQLPGVQRAGVADAAASHVLLSGYAGKLH